MPTIEPAPARAIGRGRVLDRQHRAGDVQVDGAPPRVGVHLGDRAERLGAAGARDHAVERAGRLARGGHGGGDLLLVGDVGDRVLRRSRPPGPTARSSSTAPSEPLLGAAADRDVGAVADEALRAAEPDAAPAAGDEGGETFEPAGRD